MSQEIELSLLKLRLAIARARLRDLGEELGVIDEEN